MDSKQQENKTKDELVSEREELLSLLQKLVEGDVGKNTLWKLSQGQGTETEDGKTWLAAKSVVGRSKSSLKN